jgi:hypothetical protein
MKVVTMYFFSSSVPLVTVLSDTLSLWSLEVGNPFYTQIKNSNENVIWRPLHEWGIILKCI